jgi:hypothetical protein
LGFAENLITFNIFCNLFTELSYHGDGAVAGAEAFAEQSKRFFQNHFSSLPFPAGTDQLEDILMDIFSSLSFPAGTANIRKNVK